MTPEDIARALAERAPVVVDGISFDTRDEARLNSLIGALEDGLAASVTAWGRTWAINDLRALRLRLLTARGCVG